MLKGTRFTPLLLLTALVGCGFFGDGDGDGGGAPVINNFTADPAAISAGTSTTLRWSVSGSPTSLEISGIGTVSGTSRTVTPTTTTQYTLTATNSSGSDDATATVTVTGGPVTPPPSGTRSVSFGVSANQTGPFESDADGNITSASDDRIVNVAAGGTFYAQVVYSGPNPVTGVTIYLANSNPPGFQADLVQDQNVNGFTIGAALPGCTVDGTVTSVTCIYPIAVAPGTPNITSLTGAGSEFAYVLRTKIADTAGGLPYQEPPRGYVTVGSGGGTPTPNPTPTPTPTPPPGNSNPTVSIGGDDDRDVETGVATTLVATGQDSNDDDLEYQWSASPSAGVTFSAATSATTTVTFANEGDYNVTVTVDDGNGGTGTDNVNFDVEDETTPTPVFSVSVAAVDPVTLNNGTATVSLNGTANNVPSTGTTTYLWTAEGANGSSVTFGSSSNIDTTATFTAAGTYTLRLTATNGSQNPSAPVSVVVNPEATTDTTPPTVSIDGPDGEVTTASVNFTATFSEAVTGFTNDDVSLSGEAGADTVSISGDGPTYTVAVSGMDNDGTVIVSIGADAVDDTAGNGNTASNSATVNYVAQ